MPVLPGNHHRILIAVVLAQLIIASTASAIDEYNEETGDYRPKYTFSYDVFKELPSYPMDFTLRKNLFRTQEITARQLTPAYYLQPELLPGWDDWHDKIYGTNRSMIGTYGISMYPSRFDIVGMEVGETVNVSALLYSGFGVEIYQGALLEAVYDSTVVDVEMTDPASNVFLLPPTYPFFNASWCKVVVYQIKLLKEGSTTIDMMERKPPDDIETEYQTLYGNKYISGGSILGLRVPKVRIYIVGSSTP